MIHSLKTLWLTVFLFAVLCASSHAAFWRCDLPGGVYLVNIASISCVSTHEYVVDGAARVTELTLGTNGAVVARFYYIEPMIPKSPIGIGQSLLDKAQEHAEDLAGRTGVEQVWKKVVKSYPATTHAHTVEYRLESVDQIKRLQKSLEEAWRNNKETSIKIASSDPNSGSSGN